MPVLHQSQGVEFRCNRVPLDTCKIFSAKCDEEFRVQYNGRREGFHICISPRKPGFAPEVVAVEKSDKFTVGCTYTMVTRLCQITVVDSLNYVDKVSISLDDIIGNIASGVNNGYNLYVT